MAVPAEWSPTLSKNETKNYINIYNKRPKSFNQQALESVRNHAQYHNIPFYEGEFSILEAVKQLGSGFLEGFTTLKVADKGPDNTYEAIAKNLGHLIGFAPGILSGPAGFLGRRMAVNAMTKTNLLLDTSKYLAGKKGLPLLAAEKYVTPQAAKISNAILDAGKVSQSKTINEITEFLSTGKARHIAEGAFNLGTASAISSWQGGVDTMMDSFFSGAIAGGVFRGIGNQINLKNVQAEKYARGLAGSLFMGLPATIRGATVPEQIYEYLMGAYFGGSEKPWTVARAMPIAAEVRKKALNSNNPIDRKLMDPEILYEKWDTLAPEVKAEVNKIIDGPGFRGSTKEQLEAGVNLAYEEAVKLGMAPSREKIEKQGKNFNEIKYEKFDENIKTIAEEQIKLAGRPDPRQNYIITTGDKGTQAAALEAANKSKIASVATKFPAQTTEFGKAEQSITLPRQELVKSNKAIENAVESLTKLGEKVSLGNLSEFQRDGLRRDFRNIEFANRIVAVDTINDKLTSTKGLSKYAVQMAINAGKRVDIYDKNKGWLKYDKSKKRFVTSAITPELSSRTAFFGKKAIDQGEKLAIQGMFDKFDKKGFKQEIKKEIELKEDILDIESNNIRDIGEFHSSAVDNKLSYLINTYLRPELKKTIESIPEIDAKSLEVEKIAGDIASEYLNKGSTKNRSYEWVEAIEEKTKVTLPQELKNKFRQWVAVQNQGEPVRFINTDGIKVELSDKDAPFTLGGKNKLIIEPKKPYEYAILDTITKDNKDFGLSNFAYSYSKSKPNMSQERALKLKRDYIANVAQKMDKKGYHMYGGIGDKDRIIFVKYHPNYKKIKLPRFEPSIYKEAFNRFGMTKSMHDKAAKSIIAYQEQINGVPISETIGKKGKFIQNAVEANKREQIWMTNGISGDKEFINNPKRVGKLNLSDNGNYRASLIIDPKKVQNILGKLNIELPQSVDGAIIVTDKVLDAINLDAGVPYSGQNKSFIISKNDKGTILGKFMFHKAGPELSEAMEAADGGKGVNFLMMSSAIKQSGNRTPGDYIYKKGQPLELTGGAKEIIEIRPGDLKYSQSVINDHKMLGMNESGKSVGVTFVKQMLTNLHPDMYSKTEQSTINNIYNELAQRSFDGRAKINNLVEQYRENLSEKTIETIIENFEDLGIPQVERILKEPGLEKLAHPVMLKILKTNKEAVEGAIAEGQLTGNAAQETSKNLVDFYSTADNIVKHLSKLKDGYPMFYDKYTKDYVNEAVNRFVAERVLRPKVKNAVVARMRPYDKALQAKFPELNKRDDIFYLGDLYKDAVMFTNIKGYEKTTLGTLWKKRKSLPKEQIDDIFEAISVRVPQDSPSGAQVLKFKGFTGIKDHGVLLNGRSMEAQGGADLDGDESFIYFGGRGADGRGEGMKKLWKDMYKAQKKEFYTKDGKAIKDAKKQYRDQIVINAKNSDVNPLFLKQVMENPVAKYSPAVRVFTGQETASNRSKMGPVVTMVSNMRAAWSSLRASQLKEELYREGVYKDGTRFIEVLIPKEPSAEQRDLTKALVNFTADPANEAGLIPITQMQNLLRKSYYTVEHRIEKLKQGKFKSSLIGEYVKAPRRPKEQIDVQNVKNKRYEDIKNFNAAYFSRNFDFDRAYSPFEKQQLTKRIEKYDETEMTTATMKFANTLKDTDMSYSIFNRINHEAYRKLYKEHEGYAKEYGFYRELLGRSMIREERSRQVDFTLENDLFIESNLKNMSKPNYTNKEGKTLKELLDKSKVKYKNSELKDEVNTEKYLRELLSNSNDYFSNALHNIATLERVVQIYERNRKDLPDNVMSSIKKEVELLKGFVAYTHKTRNNKGRPEEASEVQEKTDKEVAKIHRLAGVESSLNVESPGKRTKLMDQAMIDARIKEFKDNLPNKSARDMFDTLFIGSLRTGNYQKLINKAKGESKEVRNAIYEQGAKTGTTKAAFDSKEVSSENIIKFFKTKLKYMNKSFEPYKENTDDMKKFESDVDKLVNKRNIRLLGTIETDVEAYEGINPTKTKLTPENKKVVKELFEHLTYYSDAKNKDISQILAGVYTQIGQPFEGQIPKKLNQMNLEDFRLINRWFRQFRAGNFLQRFQEMVKGSENIGVKSRWWMLFPKQVTNEMMKHDIKFLPAEGYFQTKDVIVKTDKIYKPTYYGEVIQNWIGRTQDLAFGVTNARIEEFQDKFRYLDQVKEGDSIWRLAVRKSELKQGDSTGQKVYKENWEASKKNNNYFKLRNKKFSVDLGDGRKPYTGFQLVEITKNNLETLMKEYHSIIRGKPGALEKYRIGWYDPKTKTQPILDYKSFINDLNRAYIKGDLNRLDSKKISNFLDIGIDGMRHMTRSMFIDILPTTSYSRVVKGKTQRINLKEYYSLDKKERKFWKPDKEYLSQEYKDLIIKSTGYRIGYYPHYFYSNKELKKSFEKQKKAIIDNKTMTKQEKKVKIEQLIMNYKHRIGDWDYADYKMWEKLDADLFKEALTSIEKKALNKQETSKLPAINMKFNNMEARTNHMGGWMVEPVAAEMYISKLTNTYFRQLGNIMSRYNLNLMRQRMYDKFVTNVPKKDKKEMIDLVNGVVTFWKKYASEAMGNPVMVSKAEIENPNLKLKGSPYAFFADNQMANKLQNIAEKLGIKDKDTVLGMDAYNVRNFANVEGKYQLATLMTHPKTMINNVFGGTMHTFQSVGGDALLKARNIDYIRNIIPSIKSKTDLNNFVAKLGIQPEMLKYEFGLQKEFREGKAKAFTNELVEMAKKKDFKVQDIDFNALAKRYGVTDAIMKKAAKFMTIPEQMLRRDSFMAHYIKAYERFGGGITDPFHPFLVEQAKKGVQATQFLYNAPYRPAFARSSFGKMLTRFQLWSFNAVRFRNDARKAAQLYDFAPGSEAVKRLNRILAIDMFIMALSGVFMYSMFEQTLPAPWNWLQDSAEWIFGDEKERERAFFGMYPTAIAPLQIFTPPIARLPISAIRQFAEDDYTKLADYYIWTMFPFGRIARDVLHPESGLINNPMRLPEKVAGFPLTGLAKEVSRIKKDDEETPVPGFKAGSF